MAKKRTIDITPFASYHVKSLLYPAYIYANRTSILFDCINNYKNKDSARKEMILSKYSYSKCSTEVKNLFKYIMDNVSNFEVDDNSFSSYDENNEIGIDVMKNYKLTYKKTNSTNKFRGIRLTVGIRNFITIDGHDIVATEDEIFIIHSAFEFVKIISTFEEELATLRSDEFKRKEILSRF